MALGLRLLGWVLFALVTGLSAEARASSSVGMCSFEGQSIEAPPPLYPSESSELRDCEQQVDTSRGIAHAPLEDNGTISSTKLCKDVALAPAELRLPRRGQEPAAFSLSTTERGEEHRTSLRRPPRA